MAETKLSDTSKSQTEPDAFANSPVGKDIDLGKEVSNATKQTAKDTESKAAEKNQEKSNVKSIDLGEYEELVDKANSYDLIISDQQIGRQVLDHFRGKAGKAKVPEEEKKQDETVDKESKDPRVDLLLNRLANLEVNAFKQANPDMQEHAKEMQSLISRYGMTLEDAYTFAKAAKSQSKQNGKQNTKATESELEATAEGKDSGIEGSNDDSELEVLQKRINDPKATPHLDDAIDLAIRTAQRMNAKRKE